MSDMNPIYFALEAGHAVASTPVIVTISASLEFHVIIFLSFLPTFERAAKRALGSICSTRHM